MLADPSVGTLLGAGRLQSSLGRRVSLQDFSQQPFERLSSWASSALHPSSAASSGSPTLGRRATFHGAFEPNPQGVISSPSRSSAPSSPSRAGVPPAPRVLGGGTPLASDARRVASHDYTFVAAVAAERLRLGAEFEELYRKHAAKIEAAAKDTVAEEAMMELEATAFAASSSQATGHSRADVMALEGEILQETVLAEQLQASEEVREAQLREQSRARATGRPPKPSDRSPEVGRDVEGSSSEAQQERATLRQLEQRAWRAQNAVRASEAHEDLLQAHRKDLERKLREVQAETDELSSASRRLADEGQQLPALEQWEAGLAERVHQGTEAEVSALQATEDLQKNVLELENECGALWLDITLAGNRRSSEAVQLCASLRAALATPEQAPPLTLEQLLAQLEAQREERQTDLQTDSRIFHLRDQEYCKLLEGELRDASHEAHTESEQAAALKAEIALGSRAVKDAEDRMSEAASLRRENDVARRQQQVWQTSQLRMLRLIEDMQRQRVRDVQSQATVAARLADLQRDLPLRELSLGIRKVERTSPASRSQSSKSFGSPGDPNFPARGPSRLNALWSDNVALKSQLRRLEEEKEELIKSQEGLIRLVKSKMPTNEQARENLRLASVRGIGAKPSVGARYNSQTQSVTA